MLACGGGPQVTPDVDVGGPPDADVAKREVTLTVLTIDRTPDPDVTVLVADDGGPFHPVTGVGGVFRAMVVGPRFSFARECIDRETNVEISTIYNATFDDTVSIDDVACHAAPTRLTVSGSLVGVDDTHRVVIGVGGISSSFPGPATDYALSTPSGTTDFVASLAHAAQPRIAESLVIQRGLSITSPVTRDIDFPTEGVPTEEHTIAVAGAGSGGTGEQLRVGLLVGPRTYAIENLSSASDRYHAPAASQLVEGDLLGITRTTRTASSLRSIQFVRSNATDLAGDYAPAYVTSAPVASTTEPRLAGTLPVAADADVYIASTLQLNSAFAFTLQVFSARWNPGQPIDVTFPRLVGIGGWTTELESGDTSWILQASSSTLSTAPPFGGRLPLDNDVIVTSASFGMVTIPCCRVDDP